MELTDGHYASPRWSWEILDCAMPMTFDTYSNCAHQCVYCFAYFQRAIGKTADDYLSHKVRSVNVDHVKRMFIDPDKYAGNFAGYIKRRFVLQWGGLSDGFDWYERKFRKSLELLRFFREIDYPVSISTKGVWFLDDPDYVEVLKDARNTHWKYSIITTNPEHAKKLEPGTPSPQERFDALRKLNDLGVGATTLRMRPYVIGSTDLCAEEMFQQARDTGCYSLTTEFLCLEKRATDNHRERYRRISEVVGFDVWDYYRKTSYSGSGLMRLNYDVKRSHMKRLQELSEQYGVPLFISDAHHKEASTSAGCCGLPNTGPLSVYNKGQFAQAIQIAKQTGQVRWSDIAEDAAWLKDLPFVGAEGYNHGDTFNRARNRYHSMYDFMRDVWNNPKSWSSPARYFGGALVPAAADDNGDIVYLYNRPFVEEGVHVNSVIELRNILAGQRETMSADGGETGHVAYPIFVPSKGRADCATVLKVLEASRLNYMLFVEPQDEAAYRAAYPTADMMVLPGNDQGITYVRQFMLAYARSQGLTWYWQIDDNIEGFKEHNKPATARAALSFAEGVAAQYEHVALVGLDYQQYAFRSEVDFSANRFAYCCVLTNTATGLDYMQGVDTKEDTAFVLQHLTASWGTLLIHRYSMIKPTLGDSAGKRGGLVEVYKARRNEDAARRVHEAFPMFTTLIPKRNGIDVKILWNEFKTPLRINLEMVS